MKYKTMTVGELRAFLSQHPDEMPVAAEWDCALSAIRSRGIEVRYNAEVAGVEGAVNVLVFDVSDYGSAEDWEDSGPLLL